MEAVIPDAAAIQSEGGLLFVVVGSSGVLQRKVTRALSSDLDGDELPGDIAALSTPLGAADS